MSKVVEWAPFRLREGVAETALLAASRTLQEDFVGRQRGFLRRELLRAADGGYVDLILWASQADADAAMAAAENSAVCATFFGLMQPQDAAPGAGVLHFTAVAAYGAG